MGKVGARFMRALDQAHGGQQAPGALANPRQLIGVAPQRSTIGRARLSRDANCLEYGEMLEHADDLERPRKPAVDTPVRGHLRDVAVEKAQPPSLAGQQAGQHVEEGGLAGAVRSDQAVERVGLDLKIDRIACPWLVKRFVDPDAEFLYVPTAQVLATAREREAIPYDVPDVHFTHEGERCSFDAFVTHYLLGDPA